MTIRNYDPTQGCAFQGDVSIVPVPAGIAISRVEEIKPIDGRLILQEGEVTGHHHAIRLPEPTRFRDDGIARSLETASAVPLGTARLYRDTAAANAMVRAGVLTRTDLVTAFLVVEGGPVTITHEEHDGIRVPPGNYVIGRQVESAGAEERVVRD